LSFIYAPLDGEVLGGERGEKKRGEEGIETGRKRLLGLFPTGTVSVRGGKKEKKKKRTGRKRNPFLRCSPAQRKGEKEKEERGERRKAAVQIHGIHHPRPVLLYMSPSLPGTCVAGGKRKKEKKKRKKKEGGEESTPASPRQ